MEVSIIPVLGWIGAAICASILAFIGWQMRNKFVQVDTHEVEISRLKESAVTADQVRSIIHQSNEPLMLAIADMKKDINGNTATMNLVLQELAEQKGYEKAMRELRERNDN